MSGVDAVGLIDTDLLESYTLMDQRLRSHQIAKKRKSKRYLVTLLAAALAMLLCVALLVTSLPLIYVFNAEKINTAVSEGVENILFPLDKETEDGEDINPEDLLINWVEWKFAEEFFNALGAGTDDSVIDKMQSMQGGTLAGESLQNLGDFLQKMYEYYLKYRDEDTIVDESDQATTESETEEESEPKQDDMTHGDQQEIPACIETGGVVYERDPINNSWTVSKIDGVRELMDSNGVLTIAEQFYDLPVTKIDQYAAAGNTMIKELILPNTMTTIGTSAFQGCTNLKKITWGQGLVRIAMLAFAECGITSLELPSSIKSIGRSVFKGCKSLKTVTLPESMKSVSESCYSGCTSLEKVIIPEGYTTIYGSAFSGCTALKSIDLPESLRVLNVAAFANSGLEHIEIPEGIETVEHIVFKGCESLQSAYLPDSMETIPEGFFSGCTSLTDIRFPSACKGIREEAFAQCTKLKVLDMPDTVGTIWKRAFYGCNQLNQIDFSANLVSIQTEAFMNCSALQSVILPEGFANLGGAAFENCRGLIEVYLPSTLQVMQAYAFKGCSSLEEIQIPETLKYVEENVFENCYSLRSVNLPALSNDNAHPDGKFKNCKQLSIVTFEEGFDSGDMGKNMFENTALTNITIPKNVTVINEYAFTKCKNLQTVVLHENVRQILQGAFDECTSLEVIEYAGTVADFESNVTLESHAIPLGVRIICTDGEIIIA